MHCAKCDNQFPALCVCHDRDLRLERISKCSNVALRWCAACDGHADLCACGPGHVSAVKVNGKIYSGSAKPGDN